MTIGLLEAPPAHAGECSMGGTLCGQVMLVFLESVEVRVLVELFAIVATVVFCGLGRSCVSSPVMSSRRIDHLVP